MSSDDTRTEGTQASREERLAIVEEHVRKENQHDLDGIMSTFGEDAWYDNEPVGEHHDGRDSVRAYYDDLLQALPDFHIDIHQRHVTDDHVILEVTISGTHEGNWRGLPGTGREVGFDTCAVFAFDDQNKLAGERIYYDRASLLRQLGVFHDPERGIGQVLTPLTHPVTFVRALVRTIPTGRGPHTLDSVLRSDTGDVPPLQRPVHLLTSEWCARDPRPPQQAFGYGISSASIGSRPDRGLLPGETRAPCSARPLKPITD